MSSVATLWRYWHTVRHLRPVQVYGRAWFKLVRPTARLDPAPSRRPVSGEWHSPARREPSLTGNGEFVFLGQEGLLSDLGWDGPARDKLWRYNQHYFDDLNARGSEERSHWHLLLLQDWVRSNPPRRGNGWEPYPTSLRIVNWVKWALAGHRLPQECLHSLAVQTRWLTGRLEHHLLGNHLFANAKALVFAGLFFEGREATQWLVQGLRVLARELPEQVLADGGHFELSTMYHALALEDVLDLCNVAAAFPGAGGLSPAQVAQWHEHARRMRSWLDALSHPDGGIAFFNDAAFGIAPDLRELHSYCGRVAARTTEQRNDACKAPHDADVVHLPDSGYIRVVCYGAVALLDVARVGPDYLPGHAHADTLAFELSIGIHRIFVNSGTSVYGRGPERLRQRGTAAHNTVVVDDQDSSEVWSAFRVARRALPFGLHVEQDRGDVPAITVRCAHDGYSRLAGRPMHHRTWTFGAGTLSVEDEVTPANQKSCARFHLHPAVRASQDAPLGGSLQLPDGRRMQWSADQGEPRLEASTWHPRFGSSEPNTCIVLPLTDGRSRLRVSWQQA